MDRHHAPRVPTRWCARDRAVSADGDRVVGRLARAVDAALAARVVTAPAIQTVVDDLAERGRKGSPALRRLLAERGKGYRPPTTDLESAFLELVRDAGLPQPELQAMMTGSL